MYLQKIEIMQNIFNKAVRFLFLMLARLGKFMVSIYFYLFDLRGT